MRTLMLCLTTAFLAMSTATAAERVPGAPQSDGLTVADWPWWRGPNRDGAAPAGQQLPQAWSATENVLWRAAVPGRGHGSPIVVGDQVILATADEQRQTQSVLCFDRASGQLAWSTEVHSGGLMTDKGNKKATQASSTVACDGERLFINFLNSGAVYTTALSREGKRLWQTRICDYQVHQGYGSSPAIYESLVLVSADNKSGGGLAALDCKSGEIVWKHSRPKQPNYASPIVVHAAGRDQAVFIGCDLVSSYDPLSGEKLWEIEGATTECVTSTVTDGRLIFTSGGYPRNHMSAVKADGSGEVVWENNTRLYVPSMLIRDGYLYAVTDAGVAACWEAASGKEIWKERLGGAFTSSPVLVGDEIVAANESGEWFVFKANPTAFELVAKNQLGDEVYATPAVAGGRIYARVVGREEDRRQEYLYAIGSGK